MSSATAGPRTPAAVLWDMDGTLVDTEPYWIETEFELAQQHGAEWSRADALELVGNDLITSGGYIRERMGLDLSPEEIVDVLLDGVVARVQRKVPWRPGARELLTELNAAHVPCALVTMSYTRFVAPILAALPADTFSAIVTGDIVARGKPDPEPYLMAARMLGVPPADCVAIEDSNTGTISAVAAGCAVLVVPNHVRVARGDGRAFADSLQDVDLAGLSQLLPGGAQRS